MSLEKEELRERVVENLYDVGAIKFGDFHLPCGQNTPIYVDMRLVISCPKILQSLSSLVWRLKPKFNSSLLCGVPYTALALATCISLKHNISMILRRKEMMATAQQSDIKVEGLYAEGQTCLVINDVLASGVSILETAKALEDEGLRVREALVFLDRQIGGAEKLREHNIQLRSVFTLKELTQLLLDQGRLTQADADIASAFLNSFK